LEIELPRYALHRQKLSLAPGERVDIAAPLSIHAPSVLRRWWFWTAITAVVAAGSVTTYWLVRPTPKPPPYEGGSEEWVAAAP
jgi:hypothetical protein